MDSVRNTTDSTVQKSLSHPASYQVEGRTFLVEPVFPEEGKETIGTVLLKLINADIAEA